MDTNIYSTCPPSTPSLTDIRPPNVQSELPRQLLRHEEQTKEKDALAAELKEEQEPR